MIVKIEMAVEVIQEAQRRVAARKSAKLFAESVNAACNDLADFIDSVIKQLEEEQGKAEENEDT